MPYLSEFADFVKSTGPLYLHGPDQLVNDSSLRNYEAQDLLLRTKREVQGGSTIKANIILDATNDAVHYKPGDVATIQNRNYLTAMDLEWRFTRIEVTYNEKEISLNEGAGRESRFQQYTRVMKAKMAGRQTDIITKIERALVASAAVDMENSSGTTPYSIFASLTSDGLAPSGFTTVQGINPTTKTNWRNQTASYTAASLYDIDDGLIAGFNDMVEKVKFKAPSKGKKNFTESGLDQMVVLTNKEGLTNYRKVLQSLNDITRVGAQDPSYPNPQFNGVEIRSVEAFDDQSTFSSGSPGYLFVNGKYLHVVCRAGKWMDMSREYYPHNQPDTVVFYFDCWWNLANESRRRHGYLAAA